MSEPAWWTTRKEGIARVSESFGFLPLPEPDDDEPEEPPARIDAYRLTRNIGRLERACADDRTRGYSAFGGGR